MTENDDRPGADNTEATSKPNRRAIDDDTPDGDASAPDATPTNDSGGVDEVYSRAVSLYQDAGWRGVLPLPPRQKTPPPKGFTGYDGRWPTGEEVDDWVMRRPADSNLGLRVDHGVVGIDIDAYEPKKGGQTLKEAESRWGPLPDTYRSSSRSDDPISGVRAYRVPEGIKFPGKLKFQELGIGDIEIIQQHHRYMVCWPSVHPDIGGTYRWYAPTGELVPDSEVPKVDELPALPQRWLDGLLTNEKASATATPTEASQQQATSAEPDAINRLIETLGTGDEEPDRFVAHRLQRAKSELATTGSRYDTVLPHAMALVRMAEQGRVGVMSALRELCQVYLPTVSDARDEKTASEEFYRFTRDAVKKVASFPTSGQGQAQVEASGGQDYVSSWQRVDLDAVLDGDYKPPQPTMMARTDGQCLIYPGLTHGLYGESESAKSLVAQAECAVRVSRREHVLYIDLESNIYDVVGRLLSMGVAKNDIREYFRYHRPDTQHQATPEDVSAWEQVLSQEYALAVVDGVNEALTMYGANPDRAEDVVRWNRAMIRPICDKTGAGVILIDHVTKSSTGRGRFAIGSQAKLAIITGAAYTAEVKQGPLGVGKRGVVELRIGKDRPGTIRAACTDYRNTDRTQTAALVQIDSTGDSTVVTFSAPERQLVDQLRAAMRPTILMERVSRSSELWSSPMSKNEICAQVTGKKAAVLQAIDLLANEGYLAVEGGRFTRCSTYVEVDDPLSDRYEEAS